MERKGAIGIDPDTQGFVCVLVNGQEPKVVRRTFLVTDRDLGEFLQWIRGRPDVIVALEGSGGQSRPIEKLLREAGRIFYSFKPADTDKFRKAVLGQNKNNQRDAAGLKIAIRTPQAFSTTELSAPALSLRYVTVRVSHMR
jgi:hypothetical protein